MFRSHRRQIKVVGFQACEQMQPHFSSGKSQKTRPTGFIFFGAKNPERAKPSSRSSNQTPSRSTRQFSSCSLVAFLSGSKSRISSLPMRPSFNSTHIASFSTQTLGRVLPLIHFSALSLIINHDNMGAHKTFLPA